MRTVKITESFEGYPSGAKEGSKRQVFTKGEEVEVPATFADLIVGKGHAREIEGAAAASEASEADTGTKRKRS
jgi:hypothetical protein